MSGSGAAPPGTHRAPPRLSGGLPLLGHLLEFGSDPIALMQRLRDERVIFAAPIERKNGPLPEPGVVEGGAR